MKRTLSVIAMGALLPLLASDNSLRFGVKAGNSTPVNKNMKGDFKKVNPQFGGFVAYDLGSGHGVGVSLDVNTYMSKKAKEAKLSEEDKATVKKVKIKAPTLGINYTYHLNQKNDGAYLLAGVNVQHIKAKVHANNIALSVVPKHNKTIGYTVGAGYEFNKNIGAQVSYSAHKYKKIDIGEGPNKLRNRVVNLGVTYKF